MTNALQFPTTAKPTHSDKFRGAKYQSGLTLTQTAALIRADIREAVRTGALPKGVYSVRQSGGRGIDVRVSHIPFLVPHRKRVSFDVQHPKMHVNGHVIPLRSAMADALMDVVEKIMNAYKRDNSDSMTDYFDTNFYGHAEFDWEWTKGQREAMEAQERERPSFEFEVESGSCDPLRSWRDIRPSAKGGV